MSEFAGALRERITIERRNDARDRLAGALGKWRHDSVAWAAITPITASDIFVANTLSALPRWRVTMRKREGVDLRARIVWRGRYLSPRGVENDPRDPAQMIVTTEEQR